MKTNTGRKGFGSCRRRCWPRSAQSLLEHRCGGEDRDSSFKAVADASAGSSSRVGPRPGWTLSSPAGATVSFSSDFSREQLRRRVAFEAPDVVVLLRRRRAFVAAGLYRQAAQAPASSTSLRTQIHVPTSSWGAKILGRCQEVPGGHLRRDSQTQRAGSATTRKLDHYGIKLGNGDMLEWAKDMSKNDKDLVFVLDPAPFIAAGVDPAKIQGWSFAKVETKDDSGKTIQVDKLLRPFNLI